MPKSIVVKLAGNAMRTRVLEDLARLFPRRAKTLTAEQTSYLRVLAKRGWNDFEIDLALDEHGLPDSVDRLRGFLGMTPQNLGALHIAIGAHRLSIIDHWLRVVAGKLPVATFMKGSLATYPLKSCLEGVVAAVGQVDSKQYLRSVRTAVELLGTHDEDARITAQVASKLGDDADFLQAKALVRALSRAGKLTARHDALVANALFSTELVDELRALLSTFPARRREAILLAARPAAYPFGKPKPEGAWLYYDLERSAAIGRKIRKLIATTRKEELPAKRAHELEAMFSKRRAHTT